MPVAPLWLGEAVNVIDPPLLAITNVPFGNCPDRLPDWPLEKVALTLALKEV